MKSVLGFDTSTATLSVAALGDEGVIAEVEIGPEESSGRPRHSQELLAAVESVVSDVGGWSEIGRIGVGVGPGTFTGLRIGIATARALAQARSLPLAGVSSLRALAAGSNQATPVLAVLDAKRSEAFAALYGAGGEVVWEPWVGTPEALAERVRELAESPLAAGDGSVRFRAELEAAGATVPPDGDAVHWLHARHICELAAEADAGPFDSDCTDLPETTRRGTLA